MKGYPMKEGKKSRPSLGVIMIVKNEEKNLGNILSDLSGIADELVIVDTGSTDRTVEIAESFGAKLGHFTWCDDFSAARNASIELATADYLFWLDADDRIYEDARLKLRSLKNVLNPAKDRFYHLEIHNIAIDRTEDSVAKQLRIFPNIEKARFEGKVHEQIQSTLIRLGLSGEYAPITIHHMGYPDEENTLNKGRRNLAIQLKELENGKDTAYLHLTIGMSYYCLREYEKCLEYVRQARQRSISSEETRDLHKYSFNLALECFLNLGRLDDAIQEARDGVSSFPKSGVLHYNLGVLLLKAERYDEAVAVLQAASRMGIEFDSSPTLPNILTSLPQYLGMALEKIGRKDEAIPAYRESIRQNPDWVPSLKLLGRALVSAGEIDEALVHLEHAYRLSDGAEKKDLQLILSLCRLYRYKGRGEDAHRVCLDALPYFTDIPHIHSVLALTSVAVDDIERLILSLEALMKQLGMDTDREIKDVAEFSTLCTEVGRAFFAKGDAISAASLDNAAVMLDPSNWNAHILSADLALLDKNGRNALASLEKALHGGAPVEEIEKRMTLLEGNGLDPKG